MDQSERSCVKKIYRLWIKIENFHPKECSKVKHTSFLKSSISGMASNRPAKSIVKLDLKQSDPFSSQDWVLSFFHQLTCRCQILGDRRNAKKRWKKTALALPTSSCSKFYVFQSYELRFWGFFYQFIIRSFPVYFFFCQNVCDCNFVVFGEFFSLIFCRKNELHKSLKCLYFSKLWAQILRIFCRVLIRWFPVSFVLDFISGVGTRCPG